MTGAYVRVQREGTWDNIEFDQLTDTEMDEFSNSHKDDGWKWALFFARFLRDNCKEAEDDH